MSSGTLRGAVLIAVLVLLDLTLVTNGRRHGSRLAGKVKRESDVRAREADSSAEVIYDQRQVNGEMNVRLNIKNLQLQLPESQLERFQKSNMAQLIRDSVLRLFGIEVPAGVRDPEGFSSGHREQVQNPSTERQPDDEPDAPLPDISASMLQVNGNNLPAKFFLEISDFLMNTNDNDAVDDKRVETNHNQQQQLEQQHLQQQQQQQQQSSQPPGKPIYATEEITIERLENLSNVKNQTITISKKRHQLAPLPTDGSALETFSKENHQSSNATRNATESTDRFVQTKPIRLDTVVVRTVDRDAPKTLREKVIWRMPSARARDFPVDASGSDHGQGD